MKFEKVTELCKKSRKFLIFKYSEKIYFLGTGNAMFVVPDGTICTPEYLTSFAGLKPLEVENTIFDKKDFPFEFDISDIAVFAYNTPEFGDKIALVRSCGIEEKFAREYNTLCLYVAFYKNSFQSTVDIELSELSTKRPDFVE